MSTGMPTLQGRPLKPYSQDITAWMFCVDIITMTKTSQVAVCEACKGLFYGNSGLQSVNTCRKNLTSRAGVLTRGNCMDALCG